MPRSNRLSRLAVMTAMACVCAVPLARAAVGGLPSKSVNWLQASADADIERAFAQARSQGKPVLLYWGATWCPPCNQLKATLFNRQDFAAQSKHFVAVFVDGDRPAAQKLGARFKVSAYPTLVLLTPQGAEVARLPGEADPPQVLSLLEAGLAGGRPISAVLADARAGKPLAANEWRMLAFHSWDVDESGLVEASERPAVLAELAAKAPPDDGETTTRLWLKALAASDDGKGLKPDAALTQRVTQVLADLAAARTHMDVLINGSAEMLKALTTEGSAERSALQAQFEAALRRLQADATLSRGDRLSALAARVELARLGQAKDATAPALPEPLVREVRDMAAGLDRETADPYERQAVIPDAAYVLGQAGLWSDSDALLKANLARSISPYYLMSQLAGNARKLGRTAEALDWYQRAYDRSVGPATRLQWGASYVSALVDLAPKDAARIEKAASQVFADAATDGGAFHDRSARSLQRVGKKLASWNADGRRADVIRRLQSRVDPLCARVQGAELETCRRLLNSGRS
jgi:thiol-disulfide isomerase/thioredoxin